MKTTRFPIGARVRVTDAAPESVRLDTAELAAR